MKICWHRSALVAGLCYLSITSPSRCEEISVEAKVKAACLYNFAKFIEWPPSAFSGPTDSFRLCIAGSDPFGTLLDALQLKEVQGRRITLARYSPKEAVKMRSCHILYLSALELLEEKEILKALSSIPVLTVSDAPLGAVIRFFLEQEKVRFEIYLQRSRELDIKISSQLLKLAVVK